MSIIHAIPIGDLSGHQVDSNQKAEPEVPSPLTHDLWATYENIRYQSPYLSNSLGPGTDSSSSPNEDPLVTYYKSVGYLSPLDETTLELLEQILPDTSMSRISPANLEQYRVGLEDRNVALTPCPDAFLDLIRSFSTTISDETPSEKRIHSTAWNLDLQKTRSDPQEYVFQRTIMMSMIDRHRFIYERALSEENNEPILDFAVERVWNCRPMPSLGLTQRDQKCLSKSKSDLAIAFRRYAIFQEEDWQLLPDETRALVCYEGQATGNEIRVFHFITIEAKNSTKSSDDEIGFNQSLNNASQSLHNMYEFFREAGDEHVQIFFDKVRVFSVVSSSKGIKIRAHRACLTKQSRPSTTDQKQYDKVPPKRSIVKDYPLQFIHDDFFEASGSEFTRDKVVSVFERIMVGYGIGELWGHLRKAARAVEGKCLEHKDIHGNRLEREVGYYTHGCLFMGGNTAAPSVASVQASFSQDSFRKRKRT